MGIEEGRAEVISLIDDEMDPANDEANAIVEPIVFIHAQSPPDASSPISNGNVSITMEPRPDALANLET